MRIAAVLAFLIPCSACLAQPLPQPWGPPVVVLPGPPVILQPGPPVVVQPVQPQCQPFNTPVMVNGRQQQLTGTACLQADGSWRIEQSAPGQPAQVYVVPQQVYQPYYPPAYRVDPWYYGPPLFIAGVFVGGGWGVHTHPGWHGAWPAYEHPYHHRRW